MTRYRQLGLIAAPNATFIYTFGDALEAYLGPERARRPFRFRTLLDMGFTVPGNSDCTGPEPLGLSPLFNIWCAVTRRTYRDRLLAPEEAISTQQGLELFTRHAAYGLGQERIKGTLEAGKLADLVVLAEDPLAVAADHIKDVAVDFTFVGGRLVQVCLERLHLGLERGQRRLRRRQITVDLVVLLDDELELRVALVDLRLEIGR